MSDSTSLPSLDAWGYALQTGDGKGFTLPAFWDDAMAQVCGLNGWWVESQEWLMRRMMREVGIQSIDRIYRALVTEGEHNIVGRVQEPAKGASRAEKQRFKRSEEALTFTKAWADKLAYSLKALAWDLCEAFPFGSKLAEADYAPFTLDDAPFKGNAYVAPADIAPKPRTVYKYIVDRSNRVLGVRPTKSDVDMTPRSNLLILSVGGMDRIPTGEPILASIYKAWHRKQRAYEDESKTSEQSGYVYIEQQHPPQGVNDDGTVQVMASDGVTLERKSKLRVAAQSMAAARRGMVAAMPPGMKPGMMEAGSPEIFPSILDRCDREFAMAWLGSARSVLEAQHGSKADSGQGADVAETMRDWGRGKLCGSIEEFFGIVLALNFGDKYADVGPIYDIVTEEGADLTAIGNFFAGNWDHLSLDQKNVLAALGGLPPFPEEDETAQAQPTDTQDENAIAAADQANAEADVKKFMAKFSKNAKFATRAEVANGAANRRVNGKSGVVRSTDKQLRSLVTRLQNGSLTEEEFKTKFDAVLQKQHEKAYKIGFKHGEGGDTLTPTGEEYVASTISSEGEFAAGLAEGLANGTVSLAQGLNRARMYAKRTRGTANEGFREASVIAKEEIYWDLGGNEDHCDECPIYASMSPWAPDEIPAVPGEGRTPCGSSCLCGIRWKDGKQGFGPCDFGAAA